MTELEKEKIKLEETVKIIGEVLEDKKISLEKLYDEFVGPREELWNAADKLKLHITNLEASSERPYFARIDFKSDETGEISSIYIGKKGIQKDNNIIVTDWRAPISSLYYDAELGRCSYNAPEGEIAGELDLKRQFNIENKQLLDYYDVDLVSNDELLQKYLNTNNDTRIKSIVSTIQKEQNEVIRKNLNDDLIIQGVAGSGKTTVALHRLAYLVYNYINNISQRGYLVIGPNDVFLKYIKSVLPDLDVTDVEQCTFELFAKEFIGEDIIINSSENKVNMSINGKMTSDIDKFKSSMKYKEMLDKFMDIYVQSISSKDLMLNKFKVLDKNKVKHFFDVSKSYNNLNLSERVEITIDALSKYIESHSDLIKKEYLDYSSDLFKGAKTEQEREKLRAQFSKERAEIEKNCRGTIRQYFNKVKVTPTKLYKTFVSTIESFDIDNYEYISELKKATLDNIKNKTYDFEDLAALIYLKNAISIDKEYKKYRHTVVDEAQDLGEFNFYVLKKVLPSSTFSIFGDIAQSIFAYRGVDSWDIVNKVMFDDQAEVINFKKSYRTTSEIMQAADKVVESIGLEASDLVVRHGEKVKLSSFDDDADIPVYISQKIEEYKNKGYKTIAIISKTNELSEDINKHLQENGVFIPNIGANDDVSLEKFNICTISNQLAKGLEFDAVIINNAGEHIYSSNNILDMKLLYVAMTRALHELDVTYTKQIANPLVNLLNNDTTKTNGK